MEEALKVFYKNRREKRFKQFKERIQEALQELDMPCEAQNAPKRDETLKNDHKYHKAK